jgi:hypothetical protein
MKAMQLAEYGTSSLSGQEPESEAKLVGLVVPVPGAL